MKSLVGVVLVLIHCHLAANELLGPYKCPPDSKCQDISLCTSENAKTTPSGKLFYCGPEHRIDYMVCCLESETIWENLIQFLKFGKQLDSNSVEDADTVMANTNERNHSETQIENTSTESTVIYHEPEEVADTINNKRTANQNEVEIEEVEEGVDDISESESDNPDLNNVMPSLPSTDYNLNSNIPFSQTLKPMSPPDPVNSETDLPELQRDSRKSLKECVCERGPPGPPGPPGEPAKVIYVPIPVTWTAPIVTITQDGIVASSLPYQQHPYPQHQPQPQYQAKASQPPYEPQNQRTVNQYQASHNYNNGPSNQNNGRPQNTQMPSINLRTVLSAPPNQANYPSQVHSSSPGGQTTTQSQDKVNMPYKVRRSN